MKCINSSGKGIKNELFIELSVSIRGFSHVGLLGTLGVYGLLFNCDHIFRNKAPIHQSRHVFYTPSMENVQQC